jgi:hypothetical protein
MANSEALDFLRKVEPQLHHFVVRHCPGYRDDGLISHSFYPVHKLIQTTPGADRFWEECLGCTAQEIILRESE